MLMTAVVRGGMNATTTSTTTSTSSKSSRTGGGASEVDYKKLYEDAVKELEGMGRSKQAGG